MADVYSQYAEQVPNNTAGKKDDEKNLKLLTDIRKFIDERYKFPLTENTTAEQKKAWEALITDVVKEYPPKQYEVGRGKGIELANLILRQYPKKADLNEIAKLINPEQGSWQRKGKRGQSLNEEQVQERKELISQVGSLEFKILANRTTDGDAVNAAVEFFRKVKDTPALQEELDRRAFLGQPPPQSRSRQRRNLPDPPR